jgi:YidC/Oxa1 family membrane protein insertase
MSLLLCASLSLANEHNTKQINFDINNATTLNYLIDQQIKEKYPFDGFAFYLNQVQYDIVDTQGIEPLDRNNTKAIELQQGQWFAVTGRFKVLLIQAQGAKVSFDNKQKPFINSQADVVKSYIVSKPQLKDLAPELNQIRYHHLWTLFAWVARGSEWLLVKIHQVSHLSWGLSILLFALIIKLLLYPVSKITAKNQQNVSKITTQLQPKLSEIKKNYDGEEAHHKLMQVYKDLGVSPFYTLKPMLSFLIQIPVLIGVFNALGEMPQLSGQPFLWFNDLALPDMFMPLSFHLPFMGNYLNIMPLLMTLITLISTIFHTDYHATAQDNKKQKFKLYLMAASFLILFYPFPAAMVMYWAMANLLQFIQTKL